MSNTIKTVLLNALPAAGKSEIRTFLQHLGPQVCKEEFHLGEFVQLDDFVYVSFMRRIDEELAKMGYRGVFFELPDRGFISEFEWGTLTHLINEDYADLFARPPPKRPRDAYNAALWIITRIDRAREKAGIKVSLFSQLETLTPDRSRPCLWIAQAIGDECLDFANRKWENIPASTNPPPAERPLASTEGKTVIIEFSRGGPHGARFPLTGGNGYAYSYSQLSAEILSTAAVLYVKVQPKVSRDKNRERGEGVDPVDKPGGVRPDLRSVRGPPVQLMTSLSHCVPDHVMWNAYGCDDIEYLVGQSGSGRTIKVAVSGNVYYLPVVLLDNTTRDLTTFTHRKEWQEEEKAALKSALLSAFSAIEERCSAHLQTPELQHVTS